MSDPKTPDEMNKALAVPFPNTALKSRRAGGGKDLTYVEGHTIIRRLNDATDNRWNFSVDKIERTVIDDANTLLMAYVTLEIPGLGRRSHIGVQSVNARGGEDLVKGAVTDALKKAATLFGVGLELYGPDYEAGEINGSSHQPQPSVPPRARTTTQNAIPANDEAADPNAITPRQLGMIRALAEEKGIPPEKVREMHGKPSAKDLTRQEASQLIGRLQEFAS